ncbi:glycosyltransferase family 39 protein [Dehalogenimonas sp. THU2]|uniref:phospholipid carrier-dependent glycosyltransferase n=1 Tax=Dehalogenimonas sp. THU2 TaxID=3151121 RepID=UPI003218B2DE
MSKFKEKFARFRRWPHAWLAIILVVSFISHLGLLWFPNEMVLDEAYYVEAGREYLQQGELQQAEHPPLAKLFITAGMQIFGDNPFGWRIMPAVFGLITIFFFYLICRELKFSNLVTNVATAMVAFENSIYLMASVAMLDIFTVALMLGGFWAYLARKYPAAVALLALAALCKLTAIFGVTAIGLHWLFFRRDRALTLAASGLAAYVGVLLLIPGLEFILTGEWSNPLERAATLVSVPTTITFENSTHPSAVHPWQWVLGYQVMPFWWSPQYISAVNPTVWALTIPVFIWTAWLGIRRKHETAFFAAAWIFATLIVWIVIGYITDRITYIFYFVPIVGGIVVGIAVFMEKALEWARRPSAQFLATQIQASADAIDIEDLTLETQAEVIEAEILPDTELIEEPPPVEIQALTDEDIPEDIRLQTKKRLKLVYWGIGIFLAAHLLFFLALSPFTGLWPVSQG